MIYPDPQNGAARATARTSRPQARSAAPPLSLAGAPCGDAVMFSDDIPPDLIRADEALASLLDLDPDVSAWRAAGSPIRVRPSKEEIAEWKKVTGKRQLPKPQLPVTENLERLYLTATKSIEDLTKSIVVAVLARKLRSVAWLDGRRKPLLRRFWEDGRGFVSIAAGIVRWHGKTSDNGPDVDGWVLCFDRADWGVWRGLPSSAAQPGTTTRWPAPRKLIRVES